jgi:diguanylate cyclase (GGDEF)-like protein
LRHLLSYQATHDVLTGLVNRQEFERRLEHVLVEPRGGSEEYALLYLDLDRFKVVNDTCGHPAGDQLLRQITTRLREHLRGRDTLARPQPLLPEADAAVPSADGYGRNPAHRP